MKKFITLLMAIAVALLTTSCVTSVCAQTDDLYESNVDFNVVITYGTPYYNTEGLLLYYIYRNMYYYPYYYGERWYFRPYYYPRPFGYCKPLPRDFYRHRPIHHYSHYSHRITTNHREHWYHGNRSTTTNRWRPNSNFSHRSSTRSGHFGSRR